MSVSEMTHVSYFLMVLSAVFGIAAIVMFFAFNIRRSWKILRGKPVKVKNHVPVRNSKKIKEKHVAIGNPTEPLAAAESTVLLDYAAFETQLIEEGIPDGRDVQLLQDIVLIAK